jgi:3-oxoacyl-[acyl-carrier-protein] synthase II
VIVSGIGGFPAIADAVRTTDIKGIRRLSPFTVPSFLVNLAAGHISIRYGFEGAIGAPVTACAASVQAIGDAARLIRAGEADIAICGGAEACIDRVSLGGFAAARALSSGFNDMPESASRPFDRDRDGFGRRRRRRSDRSARSRAGAGCGADRRSDRLRHHVGRVSHDRRARRRGWR